MSASRTDEMAAREARELKEELRLSRQRRAQALRAEGLSLALIATRLGVSIEIVRGLLDLPSARRAQRREHSANRKK